MPLRGTTWHEHGLAKESRAEYKGLISIFVAVDPLGNQNAWEGVGRFGSPAP